MLNQEKLCFILMSVFFLYLSFNKKNVMQSMSLLPAAVGGMFTYALMKSAADKSAPTARFLLDFSEVFLSICIFILTISVLLPDSFLLLFFCCDSWISFQIYKGLSYLISDTAQGEWGKNMFFFVFFPSVIWVNRPFTHTHSVMITVSRGLGCSPLFFFFFFLFPLQHLIHHSDELNHCCVSVCSAALSWIAALIHFILGISWIARETSKTRRVVIIFIGGLGDLNLWALLFQLCRTKGESPVPFFFLFLFFLFTNFECWK